MKSVGNLKIGKNGKPQISTAGVHGSRSAGEVYLRECGVQEG